MAEPRVKLRNPKLADYTDSYSLTIEYHFLLAVIEECSLETNEVNGGK